MTGRQEEEWGAADRVGGDGEGRSDSGSGLPLIHRDGLSSRQVSFRSKVPKARATESQWLHEVSKASSPHATWGKQRSHQWVVDATQKLTTVVTSAQSSKPCPLLAIFTRVSQPHQELFRCHLVTKSHLTLCRHQAPLSFTASRSLLRPMSTESTDAWPVRAPGAAGHLTRTAFIS